MKIFTILSAVTAFLSVSSVSYSQSAEAAAEYRDFVGSNGKTIKAAIFDKSDNEVILLLPNGKKAKVGYDKLSGEDQKFIRGWSKERSIFLEQCRSLTVRELLELRGYESFKYKLKNNSMIVDGKLNGHPAEFLIDTGAHASVLHVQSANAMDCKVGPMDQVIRGIGGEAPAAWTEVAEIRLGDSIIRDQRLLSADLMKDRPVGSKKMEDAIFGAEFLTQLRAVISYKEGRIFLRPDLSDGEGDPAKRPDFRLFKSSDGKKTFKGNVVGKTSSAVKIALDNGKEIQMAISRLSKEDQEVIKNWSPAKAAFMNYCQDLTVEELLKLRQYESFEYERRGNHIYVDGLLNDTETTFMIDTGAQTTVLHIGSAKNAECEVGPLDQVIYGVGGEAPAAITKVKLLKMGTAKITNRSLISADLFKDNPGEPSFGAIFGADFMRELDGVITYRESRIFLRQD
ncbi:MAG: aspartyl protease family protein [Akkermansiaceae bacterium]|nr:aspartyl protease family protein [Akkermansiaceae bacterium]